MSAEDVSNIITKIREILENGLKELAQLEERYKTMPPEVRIDVNKVEGLPWTAYRSGVGFWLLCEKYDDAKPLKEALEKAPGRTLDLGAFHYKLGGDRDQFISKFPICKNSEK